jgi:hypothetical protein
MLSAQTGGGRNAVFIGIFKDSASKLQSVIHFGDRQKVIDALNAVQFQYNDKGELVKQSIRLDRFKKYWDFHPAGRREAFRPPPLRTCLSKQTQAADVAYDF